ncbi:hypothetical protein MAM1_0137d06318 [Mucor ambiguus]|uniref:ATP-dependent DNA helicase n=1 Tax=Mucor ambiguus TaxID=91626 RepID=A0A0C9MXE7_9FUNG|nr:hypothetical protein MAM1_0137d06318 [Mucor ambiguus]
MCDMSPRSVIASFIKRTKLIVWDECSMISKDLIATVDRLFRDISKVDAPFGGRLMVFGGDFRQQVLRADNAHLAGELQRFASHLLSVGQGDIPTLTLPRNMPSDYIQIPQDMLLPWR